MKRIDFGEKEILKRKDKKDIFITKSLRRQILKELMPTAKFFEVKMPKAMCLVTKIQTRICTS